MMKTGTWRVKGIDRKTRQMAREAAARSGVPIGVWIDRAIKSRATIAPRGDVKPLVPPELLNSARVAVPDESEEQKAEPFLPEAWDDAGPSPPHRVNPVVAASASKPATGRTAGRLAGAVLLVALMAGGYWLVSQGPADAPGGPSTADTARTDAAPEATGAQQASSAAGTVAEPEPAPLTPLQKLIAAANGGDAEAQHDLGLNYVRGDGVAKNPAVGAQWLEKSAAAGRPAAQYQLGVLYEKGIGVPRNDQTAFLWYRRAALQGHVRAQHNLATLYAEGKGTARNYAEAERWFTRASQGGLAEAHYSLGMMHEHGLGIAKDPRKAAAFYRGALSAGSAQAAEKLARLEPALQEPAANPGSRPIPDAAAPDQAPAASSEGRALTPAGIVNLQRLLARLDLEPGPADGVLGRQTVEAIKLYQRFAGLPVDGKPTIELLRDLRQVVEAMAAEAPAQAGPRTGPAAQ